MFLLFRKVCLLYKTSKIVFSRGFLTIYDMGITGLQGVSRVLQRVTGGYKGLQGVTRGYGRLQGVTRDHRGREGVTGDYKGL